MAESGSNGIEIGTYEWRQLLVKGAAQFGLQLSGGQLDLFQIYAEELLAWNRRINLTTITTPMGIAVKHFIDSLAGAGQLRIGWQVVDLGSGGGFPGIPLRIARPDLKLTLVDSVRKKNSFQKQVCRRLGLNDVRAVHARIEVLPLAPEHKGTYDAVVSRALADLTVLHRLAAPLLKKRGVLIAYRGRKMDGGGGDPETYCPEEGWRLTSYPYDLPNTTTHRSITCSIRIPA
jgi:16S rRNA (guanine527-N7)-methyltransferase